MADDEAAFDAALEGIGTNWERKYNDAVGTLQVANRMLHQQDEEIARLKAENLRLFALVPEKTYDDLTAEAVAVRAALDGLYDATLDVWFSHGCDFDDAWIARIRAAQAAARRVLGAAGVTQAGGAS